MRREGHVVATAAVTLLALAACASLKTAEPGGPDGGSPEDMGQKAPADADAPVDTDGAAELPPLDTACDEAWTVEEKKVPACAKRISTPLPGLATFEAGRVSIARASSGRVGIATNNVLDVELSEALFAYFVPDAPGFTATVLRRTPLTPFTQWGRAAKVVATGPDTLAVVSHDVESDSGDIVYVEHVGGRAGFETPLVVASSVFINTHLDAVSDGAGAVYAAYLARTAPQLGRVEARHRAPGRSFASMPPIAVDLDLGPAQPSIGQVSLALLPDARPQALVHHARSPVFSTPRYAAFDGVGWNGREVDSGQAEGVYGFDPRLGGHGTRKLATYFARRPQLDAPTPVAELKLATWEAADGKPTYEAIATGLAAPDASYPHYRHAMAVDRFGLVHVVWLEPGSGDTSSLRYKRQTRDAKGALTWVVDVIDPAVATEYGPMMLDLFVDERGRPHIAYIPADGVVRYATRYDR